MGAGSARAHVQLPFAADPGQASAMSTEERAAAVTAGWVVGVMLAAPGEPMQRWYFAVGCADQGKAEWTAVDRALGSGEVAQSPVAGAEPVQALRPLTRARMATLGLAAGEVRELGWRYPRRWLS
jgi:hypothetical protein